MNKWDAFKKFLPHKVHPYSKRNWGNGIHSLCSYYGKLKPSLTYHLVEAFSKKGDKVLDIFCGSGTVLFESINKGRVAYGFDINPISVAISSGKCGIHDKSKVELILNQLEKKVKLYRPKKDELKTASEFGFNKTLKEYYEKSTFNEILGARSFFKGSIGNSPESDLVLSCLLHILHGNRPYALSRRSHPITPYAPKGDFEYKELMPRLRNKVVKSLDQLSTEFLSKSHVFEQDVLKEWPKEVKDIDLILTSPPFFDSTKYYLTNWIRNWFIGWEKEDFMRERENFVDTIQKSNMSIYKEIFLKCKNVLNPNGTVVFHLGKSKKLDMGNELLSQAESIFNSVELFNEDVSSVEHHGIVDKGNVSEHQYLIMKNN